MNKKHVFEVFKHEPHQLKKHISLLSIPIPNPYVAFDTLKKLASHLNNPQCIPTNISFDKRNKRDYGTCYCECESTNFRIVLHENGKDLGTLLHEYTHGYLLNKYPETINRRSEATKHGEIFRQTFLMIVNEFVKMCISE